MFSFYPFYLQFLLPVLIAPPPSLFPFVTVIFALTNSHVFYLFVLFAVSSTCLNCSYLPALFPLATVVFALTIILFPLSSTLFLV